MEKKEAPAILEPEETEKLINNFTEEYEYFLKEYLFRLFGIAKDTVLTPEPKTASSEFPRVRLVDNWIVFAAFKRTYFKIPVSDMPHVNADSISLAISIIDAFLVCAEYKFANETE